MGPGGRGTATPSLFGLAIVAALIALAIAFGAQRGRRTLAVVTRTGDVTALSGAAAKYTLFPTSGRIEVLTRDGRTRFEVEMSLVIDGVERPLAMRRGDVHVKDKTTLVGEFPIEVGEERATGNLELRMDPASDLLTASLAVANEVGSSDHSYALRFGLAPEGRTLFVPGAGEVGDAANIQGPSIVLDDDVHPFALLSTQGPLALTETEPDTDQAGARPRLVVSARTETAAKRPANAPSGAPARLDISILVGDSSQGIWGRLYSLSKQPVARVRGVVTGTTERANIVALDEEGHPLLRAVTGTDRQFVIDAPTSAVQWLAALEAVHTSAPVRFTPGTPWELKLDVSAGGELVIHVTDADTHQPLIARLVIKGLDGTLDPSFGPDFRASGAGPLMDLLEPEVKTPLPAGKYRVAATKGIEWSVDAEVVEVTSGHTKVVELAPRHVVTTPGLVSCDVHVHARPSFDSPVTPEDRVLSLIAAGIDFAVPTEHNMVGDYTPALEVQRLSKQLAHVPGVEVTTYNPRYGHFGVFPYPTNGGVPPYKGATVNAVIAGARRGDNTRFVQINHPRLPQNIGYFNIINFDPRNSRSATSLAAGFDAIEVYNGYELGKRELTDRVMDDWFAILNAGRRMAATGSSDSHRIQYQWAGYPRTFVFLDPRGAGDAGGPIDTKEVVAALRRGRGFVSSGPLIDLEVFDPGGRTARPGDELAYRSTLLGKLRVRAAPWIDVTSIEVIAGVAPPAPHGYAQGSVVSLFKSAIPTRPLSLGKEEGSLEEASARTVRFDGDISLKIPESTRWLIAVARGDRAMDDTLPFMPIQPLAFTNPIYVGH